MLCYAIYCMPYMLSSTYMYDMIVVHRWTIGSVALYIFT